MNKNRKETMGLEICIVYHHPTFGESHWYYSSENEAFQAAAEWLAMIRSSELEEEEMITIVIN